MTGEYNTLEQVIHRASDKLYEVVRSGSDPNPQWLDDLASAIGWIIRDHNNGDPKEDRKKYVKDTYKVKDAWINWWIDELYKKLDRSLVKELIAWLQGDPFSTGQAQQCA